MIIYIGMTIVWLFVIIGALIFAVVALCYAGVFTAAVFWVPFREIVRLYKRDQKKKACALLASFTFAIASLSLLIWLLIDIS